MLNLEQSIEFLRQIPKSEIQQLSVVEIKNKVDSMAGNGGVKPFYSDKIKQDIIAKAKATAFKASGKMDWSVIRQIANEFGCSASYVGKLATDYKQPTKPKNTDTASEFAIVSGAQTQNLLKEIEKLKQRIVEVEKERDQAESMFEYYFAKTKR